MSETEHELDRVRRVCPVLLCPWPEADGLADGYAGRTPVHPEVRGRRGTAWAMVYLSAYAVGVELARDERVAAWQRVLAGAPCPARTRPSAAAR